MVNMLFGNGILVLWFFGAVLALGRSALADPISSWVESPRIQVETARLASQNEMDLRRYRVLQVARTQAELEWLQAEPQSVQQVREQRLGHAQEQDASNQQSLSGAVFIIFAVLGIGLAVYVVSRPTLSNARTPGRERGARQQEFEDQELLRGLSTTPTGDNGRQH